MPLTTAFLRYSSLCIFTLRFFHFDFLFWFQPRPEHTDMHTQGFGMVSPPRSIYNKAVMSVMCDSQSLLIHHSLHTDRSLLRVQLTHTCRNKQTHMLIQRRKLGKINKVIQKIFLNKLSLLPYIGIVIILSRQ